jgi:hypothetical protein
LNEGIKDTKKKIYVNPDQTPLQRRKYQELREEKDRRTAAGEKNLVIRQGKIVTQKTWTKQGEADLNTTQNNTQKDNATRIAAMAANGDGKSSDSE